MGRHTGLVLAGFVAAHIGLVLMIISLTTHHWVEGKPNFNTTQPSNTTIHKGLWKICQYDECHRLNNTLQYPYFHAVQGLSLFGALFLVAGVLGLYAGLLSNEVRDNRCPAVTAFLHVLAAISLLTAIIIFGVKYKLQQDIPCDFVLRLEWSFWLAVAAVCNLAISGYTSFCYVRALSHTPRGYINIEA